MWQRWGRKRSEGEQIGEGGENSDARMMIGIGAPWPISMPLLSAPLLLLSSPSSLNADPFHALYFHAHS